ncbi:MULTISPECIES: ABC transporter ATP-binding protein [Pantoea]|jgi:octopine/nopaline transport system ATP-binding protein|uniref:ATP-binding cassette domain-containing protein n=1 Tax=Pantoea leporis TaxID=2933780 RepID=A0ABV2E0C2_9GAMM|nr:MULTISPECIES: ATP-binding cassette domain-containing protein [Pantoea]MBD9660055.1 ATP-binding cassette domain-containing protein [Pantoea sp. PNT03]MBY4952592.1 ATP-binding cassette domain-containing protein [Pantoea sp. DY-17]
MSKPTIALSHLRKSYSGHEVLHDISLTAQDGDVISLIGASGSGKSTLLRCIPFLEVPQGGEIAVGDEVVTIDNPDEKLSREQQRRIKLMRMQLGFVFQSFNLWPHKTVLQNIIEAPIHVQKRSSKEAIEEAEALLQKVGLYEKRNAWPSQLSGGQQQRVAIARALAQQPKAILFDEPTSALDPELVGEVLRVIRSLAEEGRTMIIVTHEMGFARDVSNKAVFLHQGKIEEAGSPQQVFSDPLSARCRAFVSSHLQRNS